MMDISVLNLVPFFTKRFSNDFLKEKEVEWRKQTYKRKKEFEKKISTVFDVVCQIDTSFIFLVFSTTFYKAMVKYKMCT